MLSMRVPQIMRDLELMHTSAAALGIGCRARLKVIRHSAMAEDVDECLAARFEPARHLAQQRLQPQRCISAAG